MEPGQANNLRLQWLIASLHQLGIDFLGFARHFKLQRSQSVMTSDR